jgi:hypothetical protein
MKIYYYIFSDNEEGWFVGEASKSLQEIIDKVEKLPYPWRIKTAKVDLEESIDVSNEEIKKSKEISNILIKIFQ